MPLIQADRLTKTASILLIAAGASEEEAEIVSRHSIGANLAGHDSHGIMQIPSYIDRVERGHIVPGAPFEIIQESDTTTVINGNWGFGYAISERAMKMTIEKAKKSNIAATTIHKQSHVGRVGAYPCMAAAEGMIGMMTADSGRSPKSVAPFGGAEARLGTNPICYAIPSNLDGAFFIDMATSAVANGKVKLALARGQDIPEGWVIDKDGNPTTNPQDLYDGGVLLPLGGPEGHKGYGLSAMVEIFSGLLTGLGFGVEASGRHNDGVFMVAFKVEAFRSLEVFKAEVDGFAKYLKATRKQKGVDEIFYPGELEHIRAIARSRDGIEIEDSTIAKLMVVGEKYGVADKLQLD
ncbi:MAG: Ldh family oxidoreductase [Alphaproteobacteria bacterium]|nr:Ldh family oxidoreductase [Alphaproteobacteria bacterium]